VLFPVIFVDSSGSYGSKKALDMDSATWGLMGPTPHFEVYLIIPLTDLAYDMSKEGKIVADLSRPRKNKK
jgi:hypothetical protein